MDKQFPLHDVQSVKKELLEKYASGNMEMIEHQPSEDGVEFLESRIVRDADGKGLVSRYFNKNMPWVGKQKIVRYKNYFSFCDRSTFCSVVISTIQRIATVSTHANDA